MVEVFLLGSGRSTTSKSLPIHMHGAFLLNNAAHNTSLSQKSDRIDRGCALREAEVTQAIDGFAIAGPMICQLDC